MPNRLNPFKSILKNILQFALTQRRFVWKGQTEKKIVAITFDDGPHSVYTPQCLDILQKCQTKGTFFLIGQNAEAYPGIVRQIQSSGHAICIHTYSHPPLYRMTYSQVKKELKVTQNLLMDLTGELITIYRPPRGQISVRLLCYAVFLKLTTVLWTTTFSDHKRIGTEYLLSQIDSTSFRAGDIILLHDNNPYTLKVLPVLIQRLQNAGLECVTIQELIGWKK